MGSISAFCPISYTKSVRLAMARGADSASDMKGLRSGGASRRGLYVGNRADEIDSVGQVFGSVEASSRNATFIPAGEGPDRPGGISK